jgi:hypothetical protein
MTTWAVGLPDSTLCRAPVNPRAVSPAPSWLTLPALDVSYGAEEERGSATTTPWLRLLAVGVLLKRTDDTT